MSGDVPSATQIGGSRSESLIIADAPRSLGVLSGRQWQAGLPGERGRDCAGSYGWSVFGVQHSAELFRPGRDFGAACHLFDGVGEPGRR
jgi:hypothetical protein